MHKVTAEPSVIFLIELQPFTPAFWLIYPAKTGNVVICNLNSIFSLLEAMGSFATYINDNIIFTFTPPF